MLSKHTRKIILISLLTSGFLFANTIVAKVPAKGKKVTQKTRIINSIGKINKNKPNPAVITGNPGKLPGQQQNSQNNSTTEDILSSMQQQSSIVTQPAATEDFEKKRDQAVKEIAELDNRIEQLKQSLEDATEKYNNTLKSTFAKASLKEEAITSLELRMIQIKSEIKGCEMRKDDLHKIVNDKVAIARQSILHHFSNALIERDITNHLSEI